MIILIPLLLIAAVCVFAALSVFKNNNNIYVVFIVSAVSIMIPIIGTIHTCAIKPHTDSCYYDQGFLIFEIPIFLLIIAPIIYLLVTAIQNLINKNISNKNKYHAFLYFELIVGFAYPFMAALSAPVFRYKVLASMVKSNIEIFNIYSLIPVITIISNWLGLLGIVSLVLHILGKPSPKYPKLTLIFVVFGLLGYVYSLYNVFSFVTLITILVTLHFMYLGRSYLQTAFNKSFKRDALMGAP